MSGRNVVFIILFIGAALASSAQNGSIKGIVLDEQSAQPLPFASIFVNHTTLGTNADDKGSFLLENIVPGVYDLIISYIGHKPHQQTVTVVRGGQVQLRVTLSLVTLSAVEVVAKRDPNWFKQMEKFKRLFLGQGPSAKLCKIINPHALSFSDGKASTFSAQSTDPLEIDNMYLGYRVTYDLKKFVVNTQNYLVVGYVRFQEMSTTDSLLAKKWTKNRSAAYEGSVAHFFKSVADNTVEEDGYVIYEDQSELKHIVRSSRFLPNLDKIIFEYSLNDKIKLSPDSTYYKVKLPIRSEIHYRNGQQHSRIYWDIPYPVSWIEVRDGVIEVAKDGTVLNPLKMTLSGQMFERRIDKLLPNDYVPAEKRIYVPTGIASSIGLLSSLSEKPYLHTDRSYYYPGENIWFKNYMNYSSQVIKDSLSRVLHVDLVNSENDIMIAKAFPIAEGLSYGDLSLPGTIQPGNYTLRAYTRWMLNFDTAFVYRKPIRILSYSESVKDKVYAPEENIRVLISTDKEEYAAREKIILSIDTRDDLDNTSKANLSVSVTDILQAVPMEKEQSILNDYAIPDVVFPDSLPKKSRLAIQNGFDIRGRFYTSKGKAGPGILNFSQENVAYGFKVTTTDDGDFFFPDLLLYDTSKLSYVARTLKGKYGTVKFDSLTVQPKVKPVAPLLMDVIQTEMVARRPSNSITLKATMLRPVTIQDKRIEAKRLSVLDPDYEITGDWLRERYSTDVLYSMQSRVPGMRIITSPVQKFIILSGGASLSGFAEPLVLIDGVAVNNFLDGAAQAISNLSPVEIDRIEVSKFGSAAAYGARGANGVIAVFTRTGHKDLPAMEITDYDKSKLQPLNISGFSSANQFYSPDYSNPERLKDPPDNRVTIFWAPMLSTTGKGPLRVEFYAADVGTQYRVVVEGVNADGQPVRGEKMIMVRKAP